MTPNTMLLRTLGSMIALAMIVSTVTAATSARAGDEPPPYDQRAGSAPPSPGAAPYPSAPPAASPVGAPGGGPSVGVPPAAAPGAAPNAGVPAAPGSPAPGSDVHAHDGVFLRLRLGFGGATASRNGASDTFGMSGPGGSFALSIGRAVAKNLMVYGELFDSIVTGGHATQNGEQLGTGTGGIVDAFAGGVSYYFEPTNTYVAGAVGLALLQFSLQPTFSSTLSKRNYPTTFGLAMNALAGREWWVSEQWGLGIALQIAYGRAKDKDMATETWTSTGVALLFSATCN